MTTPPVGPCPTGCLLPTGHDWEQREPDGTCIRWHEYYRSDAGFITCRQGETWSPLINDAMLSEPFVEISDGAGDEYASFTTRGAGSLAFAAATAARICRTADKRWSA